jgi:hypothetical protein
MSDFLVLRGLGVLAAGMAMVGGLWFVFARLRSLQQGFGPNSLKALGIVLFVPSLLIVGIVIPDFKSDTLSALLGTVAGYVLSQSRSADDKPASSEDKPN